jgi:hypothetical protein
MGPAAILVTLLGCASAGPPEDLAVVLSPLVLEPAPLNLAVPPPRYIPSATYEVSSTAEVRERGGRDATWSLAASATGRVRLHDAALAMVYDRVTGSASTGARRRELDERQRADIFRHRPLDNAAVSAPNAGAAAGPNARAELEIRLPHGAIAQGTRTERVSVLGLDCGPLRAPCWPVLEVRSEWSAEAPEHGEVPEFFVVGAMVRRVWLDAVTGEVLREHIRRREWSGTSGAGRDIDEQWRFERTFL